MKTAGLGGLHLPILSLVMSKHQPGYSTNHTTSNLPKSHGHEKQGRPGKGLRVEQPKETGLPSTAWDPGLAPRTGNNNRGKTGEIWTESEIQLISLHPCSLPLLTRLLHVCKRIMLGEAGWRVGVLSRQVLCKSKVIPKQTMYYIKGSPCLGYHKAACCMFTQAHTTDGYIWHEHASHACVWALSGSYSLIEGWRVLTCCKWCTCWYYLLGAARPRPEFSIN